MGEGIGAPAAGATPPPRLVVGGQVSGGRYELLAHHGGVAGQAFWHARDKRLHREVALTFVDPLPGEQPPGSATGVLDRTVALTGVSSDGLARVLDVIRGRAGGIVVSEWVPGRSLAAAVASPEPGSAVAAVWGLSDAATSTEEKGLVLGLDSPDRIRVTEDGRALLAFPGVSPSADARGDVRGLGATLYCLLTGTWPVPLPEGSDAHTPVDGRPGAAPLDDDDEPVDPTLVRSGVPQDYAVLAMRSLDGSTVSSAATVRSAAAASGAAPSSSSRSPFSSAATAGRRDAATTGDAGAGIAGAGLAGASIAGAGAATAAGGAGGSAAPAPGYREDASTSSAAISPVGTSRVSATGDTYGRDTNDGVGPEAYSPPDEKTQKRRWQIMAGTSAVAVIAVALLGAWMLGAITGNEDQTPLSQQLDAIERAAEQSRSAAAASAAAATEPEAGDEPTTASTTSAPSTPVEVSDATSWQPSSSAGVAENSASASNVVDDDPSTSWSTDTYRSQLGDGGSAFKSGIGLMLTLDDARETGRVVVHSEDDGVRFEIRSADSDSPSDLDDTTLLGEGTVRDGTGTATIDDSEESDHVLVWITRLGTSGPEAYQAEITEVELSR